MALVGETSIDGDNCRLLAGKQARPGSRQATLDEPGMRRNAELRREHAAEMGTARATLDRKSFYSELRVGDMRLESLASLPGKSPVGRPIFSPDGSGRARVTPGQGPRRLQKSFAT